MSSQIRYDWAAAMRPRRPEPQSPAPADEPLDRADAEVAPQYEDVA